MPVTLEKIPGREDQVILSMGPQHPSTHGVLRLVLDLEGETVIRAIYDIGYLHTGFEKSFEGKTYSQGITLTDRMDYLAPLSNNLGFCLAVEKLLGLGNPPAGAVDPRAPYGIDAHPEPPGVAGNARHRPGGNVGFPLLLPRARTHSEHF